MKTKARGDGAFVESTSFLATRMEGSRSQIVEESLAGGFDSAQDDQPYTDDKMVLAMVDITRVSLVACLRISNVRSPKTLESLCRSLE